MVKLSKLTDSNRRYGGGRAPEPPAINQVIFVKSYVTSSPGPKFDIWNTDMQMFLFPLVFHRVQSPSFLSRYQH
jgi:hypothetical protein